jgi:hypothetical protein
MVEMSNMYEISPENPEGKNPLDKPRRRWWHNVRMGHSKTKLTGVDWFTWLKLSTVGRLL